MGAEQIKRNDVTQMKSLTKTGMTKETKEHSSEKKALQLKLAELRIELDWLERLDMTNSPAPLAPELASYQTDGKDTTSADDPVHNDFQRELQFYRQGQAAVLESLPRLHKLSIKTKRPEDYFAQMAKSDDHMKKVREALLSKEMALERRDKVRKLRQLKKYGKQVQQEVLKQRQSEKKEMLETVKKIRKEQRNKNDATAKKGKPEFGKTKSQMDGSKGAAMNRMRKDAKYGRGGQKKRSKYNTAESAADVTGFKSRNAKPKGKQNFTNKRLGKGRRQKLKNRRKK